MFKKASTNKQLCSQARTKWADRGRHSSRCKALVCHSSLGAGRRDGVVAEASPLQQQSVRPPPASAWHPVCELGWRRGSRDLTVQSGYTELLVSSVNYNASVTVLLVHFPHQVGREQSATGSS